MKHKHFYLMAILSGILLQGCTPIVIGSAAATTASVAHDRRTNGIIVDDNTLELKVYSQIMRNTKLSENSHVDVTGYNGNILLTGEAANPAVRDQIGRLAARHAGVRNVYNQIVIGPESTFLERAYDTKQTAKAKAALFDVDLPHFDPSRIKITTEHGITYLMGLVTPQEGQAAAAVISRVSGVKKVVTIFEPPYPL